MKKFLPLILLGALCASGWYAYSHRANVAPNTSDAATSKFITRAEKRDIDLTWKSAAMSRPRRSSM